MRTRPSTRVPAMMSFMRFSVRRNVLLPQPGWSDERGDQIALDSDRDVLQRSLGPVVEVQGLDVNRDRMLRRGSRFRLNRNGESRGRFRLHGWHRRAQQYPAAVSTQFQVGKFYVNPPASPRAAGISASARKDPICRRSSSWITSTLRRASRTRKPNSSDIDAYSRSSARWYARKLS